MTVFGSVLVAAFTGLSIWILTKQDGYCYSCNGVTGTAAPWGWGITGFETCGPNFQVPRRIEIPSEAAPQPGATDNFATLTLNHSVKPAWNSSSSHYSYGWNKSMPVVPMALPIDEVESLMDDVIDEDEDRILSLPDTFLQVACPIVEPYRNATKCSWE